MPLANRAFDPSRGQGRAAFRSTCEILAHNPHYAYRFYDDERCAALLREHFAPAVLEAWFTLRAGAAKADLWRYCALYVHGGVYLDLDASICGPLDRPVDFGDDTSLIQKTSMHAFMYDAEANLIQWVLIAAPRDPVLLRTIELSVARILSREPNIFVATGPSVFTDAFIAHHSELRGGQIGGVGHVVGPQPAVYASRTSMSWNQRLDFLQRHGALSECSAVVRATYDGYTHADVYVDGAHERYLPTWGSEPTRGLYHPLSAPEAAPDAAPDADNGGSGDADKLEPFAKSSRGPSAASLGGSYSWTGGDVLQDDAGGELRLAWQCRLELSAPRAKQARALTRVHVLLDGDDAAARGLAAAHTGGICLPYPTARFVYECVRTDAAGTREVGGTMHGVWRQAPGKAQQLHLFEWRLVDAAAADGGARSDGDALLTQVEAPSVMSVHVHEGAHQLDLEGWEGGAEDACLAARIRDARRGGERRSAQAESVRERLRLPMIFRTSSGPHDAGIAIGAGQPAEQPQDIA